MNNLLSFVIILPTIYFAARLISSDYFDPNLLYSQGMNLALKRKLRIIYSHQNLKKDKRLDFEFSEMIEMFALATSAGESLLGGFKFLASFPNSSHAKLFNEVIELSTKGISLMQAVDLVAERSSSNSFRKFSNTVLLAMERGSPLSIILLNQAAESRSSYKAELLTAAGRAEIALLIPVVFLILPLSVVFTLWPSLHSILGIL